jgi:hypothetical protein
MLITAAAEAAVEAAAVKAMASTQQSRPSPFGLRQAMARVRAGAVLKG